MADGITDLINLVNDLLASNRTITKEEMRTATARAVQEQYQNPASTRRGVTERAANVDPVGVMGFQTRQTEANARARTAQAREGTQEAKAEQERQKNLRQRNITATTRAKTQQIETENEQKRDTIEKQMLSNAQAEQLRLNRIMQGESAKAQGRMDVNDAAAANRIGVMQTGNVMDNQLLQQRHINRLNEIEVNKDARLEILQAQQAGRTGGGGSGGNFMGRFLGGRMGNVGGSLLYAQGAMANELGTGGGKMAANMASVSRGLGSMSTAVELLGMASGGTTLLVMGTVMALIGAGVGLQKFNEALEKSRGLTQTTGLYALGEKPTAMGLGSVSQLSSGEMFAGVGAESVSRFQDTGWNQQGQYGMLASSLFALDSDFAGAESSMELAQRIEQAAFIARTTGHMGPLQQLTGQMVSARGANPVAGSEMAAYIMRGNMQAAMGVANRPIGNMGLGLNTGVSFDFSTPAGEQMTDFLERQYKMNTGEELASQAMYDHARRMGSITAPGWWESTKRDLTGINPAEIFMQKEAYSLYGGTHGTPEFLDYLERIANAAESLEAQSAQRTAQGAPSLP